MIPNHSHVAALLGLCHQAVDEDRLGFELVATVNDGHRLGNIRQIQRFFNGGVAATDDHDVLAFVEKTVAGGAGGDAFAMKFLFTRQAQIFGRRAGRDDQCVTGVFTAISD